VIGNGINTSNMNSLKDPAVFPNEIACVIEHLT